VKYTLDVAVSGEAKKPNAATAATSGNAGPSRWDASGSVKRSAASATLDKQCGFRVVRQRPAQAADIWIANIARAEAESRFLRYQNKVSSFTTNDQGRIAWQRQDYNWWVSVDGNEFYLIPDALIDGG